MTPKENLFSVLLIFHCFIMPVWTWILLDRENYSSWSLKISLNQCHSNPVLVPLCKPPDPVKDLYDGQTYEFKTRVDMWNRMDVIPVEYVTLAKTFHLKIWFFRFITGITFNFHYVLWQIISLLVWIVIWTKLRIRRVSPDPVRWSC